MRPQDVLVLLKVAQWGNSPNWTYDSIARELGVSASVVHRSIKGAERSGLFNPVRREVNRQALVEFLRYGVPYVFPPEWGGEARGIPTAWAAEPLVGHLSQSGEHPPVWPDPHGHVRGIALQPIDARMPAAARDDPPLGELLALVDAIRIGGARERDLATRYLRRMLEVEDV